MVAEVSGSGLGLFGTSAGSLGKAGVDGNAALGQGREQIYVNTATGNLVVQHQDEFVVAKGVDVQVQRTYNAQGKLNDDNADNWKIGLYRRLYGFPGTINASGSTITKVFGDGSEVVYTYDGSKYVGIDGDGAHDTLTWNATSSQWTWTDGSGRNTETYDASGKLLNAKDTDGNQVTYYYEDLSNAALLTRVVDASGQTTYLNYTGNNLTQIRVVSGDVSQTQTLTRYYYDTNNRLKQVVVDLTPTDAATLVDANADGFYDGVNGQTYVTNYTYDATSGYVSSITQSGGTVVSFTYVLQDGKYRVKTVKDGNNNVTTYTYTTLSTVNGQSVYLQTDVTDALGQITTYTQDTAGRLTKVQRPGLGGTTGSRITTQYAYDAQGNVIGITEDPTGLNRITTFQYDANGNLTLSRDTAGNTVTRTYSTNNQLVTETRYVTPDPDGAGAATASNPLTTRYAYDAEDHLRFVISADGRVTEHQYNAAGQRTAQLTYTGTLYNVSALSATTALTEAQLVTWVGTQDKTKLERTDYVYDFRGNVTTETSYVSTDSAGVGATATASKWQYVYDQRGQLLQKIDARAPTTYIPNRTAAPDANASFTTTYTYDGLGRLLTTTDWLTNTATAPNATQYLTTGMTRTTSSQYDDANNKIVTTMANGLITTTVYDKTGSIASVSNVISGNPSALGTTAYAYDTDGRLRMVTDPTGIKTFTIYDEASRIVGTVDGNGTLTELVYNGANQVIKTVKYADAIPAATLTTLATTNNPTLASLKAVIPTTVGRASDQITRSVYDAAGRLVYTIDPVGAVTQTFYDGLSRVTDTVQYAATVTIAAAEGEIRPVAAQLVAGNAVTTRVFNNASGTQVGSLTVSATTDRRTRNFYDNDGHLTGTLDGMGYLVEYQYNAAGHLIQQTAYANQATDAAIKSTGTLSALKAHIGTDTETTIDYETDINTYFYYDGEGRQVGVLDGEGYLTETQYDVDGQVTASTRYNKALSYNANFTTLKGGIAATDTRLTTSYTYDGAGRVLTRKERIGNTTSYIDNNATTYVYDAANNLISQTREGRTTQTQYDALGRVTKTLSGEGSVALAALGAAPTQAQIDLVWARYGTSYTYDPAGRRTSMTAMAYDPVANTTQSQTTYYYYNNDGQVQFTVMDVGNSLSEVTENRYNALNQLTDTIKYVNRVSIAGITTVELTSGILPTTLGTRIIAAVNSSDAKTSYTYKLAGQLASTLTVKGARTDYAYNAFGQLYTQTAKLDSRSGLNQDTITNTYDQRGLLKQSVQGVHTETYGYDAFGRRTTVTDQFTNVTKTDYDRLGRAIKVYDALSKTASTTYDAFSRTLTVTDRNSNTTSYIYNDATRTIQVTSPKGTVIRVQNALGETVSVTNEGGSVTQTVFNKDGYVTDVTITTDNLTTTSTTHYDYDSIDRTVTVKEGYDLVTKTGLRTTQYLYDSANRRTQEIVKGATVNTTTTGSATTTSAKDLITQYKYDGKGNLSRKIDPANNSTWYVYDADNRLTYTIDALGGVTQTTYNEARLVSGTRRYANTMAVPTVDVVSTVTVAASLNDRVEQSVYDTLGREVYKIQDVMIGAQARAIVTKKDYDANGNVIRTTAYATDIASGTYSSVAGVSGALTTANAAANAYNDRVQYTAYDKLNRAAFSMDAQGAVTQHVYDDNGNVTHSIAYATRRDTTLATDLTSFQTWAATASIANDAGNRTTKYWYDGVNRVRFTLDAEGYLTEQRYDDANRTQTTHKVAIPLPLSVTTSPDWVRTTSASDQLTVTQYDYAGRVKSVTDAANNTESYSYDAVGNKISYTNKKGATWNYQYDANHRLIAEISPEVSVTSIVSEAVGSADVSLNQLRTGSADSRSIATRITYDALGNVRTRQEGVVGAWSSTTKTFTEIGAQTQVRTTSYEYDQLGRQVKVTFPPVDVYNGTPYSNGTGDITKTGTNVTASTAKNVALTSQVFYDILGNAFMNIDVAGNVSLKRYDKLGRVIQEVDAENYVTDYTYDVFGNQLTTTRHANPLSSGGSATMALTTNMAMTGSTISKVSGGSTVWDSGFVSNQGYSNAFVRFIPAQADKYFMVGLNSDPNTNANHTSIDYALFCSGDGTLQIYEGGTQISTPTTYAAGDVLSISAEGGFVNYYKNGLLLRSVATASNATLYADSSFLSQGAMTTGIDFGQNAAPASLKESNGAKLLGSANITVDQTTAPAAAEKTSGSNAAWDSGFQSNVGHAGAANVEFVPSQNNKAFMVGLNSDPATDNNYTSLDYALYCAADGTLRVYESGVQQAAVGTYVAGDVLKVSYDGTAIKYYKNGTVLRTVTVAITARLFADSSFYNLNAKARDIKFYKVSYGEGVLLSSFPSNTATRYSGGAEWDSGFTSLESYTGGAAVSFMPGQTNGYFMVGLNTDPTADNHYQSIDYALFCSADGTLQAYESGVQKATMGTYVAGDALSVIYDGSAIKYVKNGTVLRTVSVVIAQPLYADASFLTVGAQAKGIRFTPFDVKNDPTQDRTLIKTYDNLNRVIKVEQPAVLSYDAFPDFLASGGGETYIAKPTTLYQYNAFGEVSTQTDFVGHNLPAFTNYFYDRLGQRRWTVDALGHITEDQFDALGNITLHTEYAKAKSGWTPAAALPIPDATSGDNRQTRYNYDYLNRKVSETQIQVSVSDLDASASSTGYVHTGKIITTKFYSYDAVGNVTATTQVAGDQQRAWVTAFSSQSSVVTNRHVVAYTNSVSVGYQNVGATPVRVEITYSLSNGTTATTTSDIASGGTGAVVNWVGGQLVAVNKIRVYGKDGSGNYTVVLRESTSATSYNYYDALGRVIATAEATRNRGDGTLITPLTLMKRDAYGNMVESIQYAGGVVYANETGFKAVSIEANESALGAERETATFSVGSSTLSIVAEKGVASTLLNPYQQDRISRYNYDKHNRLTHTENARGDDQFSTYTARGEVAQQWQYVTNAGVASITTDDTKEALVSIFQYDKLGRQTAVWEPIKTGGVANFTARTSRYNAFGEVTQKSAPVGLEYFDYDQLGRVWRTNSGDGVDKVYLYNLQGKATATITASKATGVLPRDLKTLASSSDAYNLPASQQVREETAYDVLGRVKSQRTVTYQAVRVGNLPSTSGLFAYWEKPTDGTAQTFQYRLAGTSAYSTMPVTSLIATAAQEFSGLNGVDIALLPPGSYEFVLTTGTKVSQGTFYIEESGASVDSQVTNTPVNNSITPSWTTLYGGSIGAAFGALVELYNPASSSWVQLQVAGPSSLYGGSWYGWPPSLADGTYKYRILQFNIRDWSITYFSSGTAAKSGTTISIAPYVPAASPLVTDAGNGVVEWGAPVSPPPGMQVVLHYRPHTDVFPSAAQFSNKLPVMSVGGKYRASFNLLPAGQYDYQVRFLRADGTFFAVSAGTVVRPDSTGLAGSASDYTTISNAASFVTQSKKQTLDRWGNALTVTDASGAQYVNTYNYLNQVISTSVNGVPVGVNYYDGAGRLIATKDGNGNYNRYAYNAAGQLVGERHADDANANVIASTKSNVYNAFGEQIQITDEEGYKSRYGYDKAGNLTDVTREVNIGGFAANSQSTDYGYSVSNANLQHQSYVFDQAGRRIKESIDNVTVNGVAGQQVSNYIWYDLQSNVRQRRTNDGYETIYSFDEWGNKILETNANKDTQTWTYWLGHLVHHMDLAGKNTYYNYGDETGLLNDQNSQNGQNIKYFYSAQGQVIHITDRGTAVGTLVGVNRDTDYGYDVMGRKVREQTWVDSISHQQTFTHYDNRGRIDQVTDPTFTATYTYDNNNNRTHIQYKYRNGSVDTAPGTANNAGLVLTKDLWYAYDKMNRVTISEGVGKDANGNVLIDTDNADGYTQGTSIAYDKKGNRVATTQYGFTWYRGSIGSGNNHDNSVHDFLRPGIENHEYKYDGLSRLTENALVNTAAPGSNHLIMDAKIYDGASRVTYQETEAPYGGVRSDGSQENLKNLVTRRYTGDGRLDFEKHSIRIESLRQYEVWYRSSDANGIPDGQMASGYDAVGNVKSYVVKIWDTASTDDYEYTSKYNLAYRKGDSYLESDTSVDSVNLDTQNQVPSHGETHRTYNSNGELVAFRDDKDHAKDRYFANNAQGQALSVIQGNYGAAGGSTISSNFQSALQKARLDSAGSGSNASLNRFAFAAGNLIGQINNAAGRVNTNFDNNYTEIDASFPAAQPSGMTVQSGDTLRVIATRVYGDSNLWYLIADENGLTEGPDDALTVGIEIRVPNTVVSLKNDATTFKPFNAQDAIGDTTPTQPIPPPPQSSSGGCGVLGMIIIIVVAIIVTIYTAGAAAGAFTGGAATAGGTAAAGTAVLTGAGAGVGLSAGAAIGAAAIGGAVGSIASQLVGMAIGAQDGFNWKGVAMGAIGAGVGAGLGAVGVGARAAGALGLSGDVAKYGAIAINAVAGNALTQGIAVATGIQSSFNWRDVAISAVAAPVAAAVGGKVGGWFNDPTASNFAGQFSGGVAGSLVRGAFGGKIDMTSVLADAFGNALGNSIVDSQTPKAVPVTRSNATGGGDALADEIDINKIVDGMSDQAAAELAKIPAPTFEIAKPLNNNPRNAIRSGSNVAPDAKNAAPIPGTFYGDMVLAQQQGVSQTDIAAQREAQQPLEEVVINAPANSKRWNDAQWTNYDRLRGMYGKSAKEAAGLINYNPVLANTTVKGKYTAAQTVSSMAMGASNAVTSIPSGLLRGAAWANNHLGPLGQVMGQANTQAANWLDSKLQMTGADPIAQDAGFFGMSAGLMLLGPEGAAGAAGTSRAGALSLDAFPEISASTRIGNQSVTATIKPVQMLEGDPNRIAVMGRSMDAVNPYADALRAQGKEVSIFSSEAGTVPDSVAEQFRDLRKLYGGNAPNAALVNSSMFDANITWVSSVKSQGYTVVDLGNPFANTRASVFYNAEQLAVFGKVRP